jgi:hypothetical protein
LSEKELTRNDIQSMIQEKLADAEKQTKETFLFSHIDAISVN